MSRSVRNCWFWCFFSVLFGTDSAFAGSGADARQVWKGVFHQTAPMEWSGPMELYLRYESEALAPQEVDGVLTWPTLGMARVKVVGFRKEDGSMELQETECLQGDCSQVVIGGKHFLKIEKSSMNLKGKAKGKFGLQGEYTLEQK